jgi:hypothetical protein
MKELIIITSFMECLLSLCILVDVTLEGIECLNIFNPIYNYKTWTSFNWFGISILTLIINLLCIPMSLLYWIYKLFTVGRKRKNKGER